MAERNTIARPYANAAFAYARQEDNLSAWSAMLAIGAQVAKHELVKPLLGNPHVAPGTIASVVAEIASVDAQSMTNFLQLLETEGRIGLLPEIAELYERLYQDAQNTIDVVIEAAQPMAEPQRELIQKSLARRLDRQVSLAVSIDETLLGGAVIRVGDQVIDGSVKGRLQQLAATLQQ